MAKINYNKIKVVDSAKRNKKVRLSDSIQQLIKKSSTQKVLDEVFKKLSLVKRSDFLNSMTSKVVDSEKTYEMFEELKETIGAENLLSELYNWIGSDKMDEIVKGIANSWDISFSSDSHSKWGVYDADANLIETFDTEEEANDFALEFEGDTQVEEIVDSCEECWEIRKPNGELIKSFNSWDEADAFLRSDRKFESGTTMKKVRDSKVSDKVWSDAEHAAAFAIDSDDVLDLYLDGVLEVIIPSGIDSKEFAEACVSTIQEIWDEPEVEFDHEGLDIDYIIDNNTLILTLL